VTFVGLLIFIYSLGYMAHDDNFTRFFCFLSLFAGAMLGVVIANSLLLLFMCWEVVGLTSYLLIGFWFHRPAAAAAAKKAFITTRVGDLGLLLGMVWLYAQSGTLIFYDHGAGCLEPAAIGGLGAHLTMAGMAVSTAIGLLIFCGAVGKSGQVPLHVWLPDAMEGPTPVSALIHAATMVTAGVYLIVRCHPLFENAYVIEDLAAGLGAATLLMAGLIALVQTDIKRVIAYSTMSQIGYMFVGAGLGAYPNAMFHLMTHAFFKALLFLAAGIAIHAVVGEQDIRKLAGVGKLLPFTKWVFLVGSLALVGIFPFAGFFSKDAIIAAALDRGWYGDVIYVACLAGAFLTGIYAFRLFFIVFTGEPSPFAQEHFHSHHGQEGPISMLWTVGALGVLSVVGGLLQFAPIWHLLSTWLDPVDAPIAEATSAQEWVTSALAILVGLAGIGVAWAMYGAKRVRVPRSVRLFEKKFYWDELYDLIWYRTGDLVARGFYALVEAPLIGGSIAAVTGVVGLGSRELSVAQNGLVRSYALALAGGLAILTVVFLAVR
jgi:NADH-quinone oxidoreductase subunit L